MNTHYVRRKAQSTFFDVAQPRLGGTIFRLALTLGTSLGCPHMANPAVSLLVAVNDLATTLSLLLRLCGCYVSILQDIKLHNSSTS
jgi:hypothetical protein